MVKCVNTEAASISRRWYFQCFPRARKAASDSSTVTKEEEIEGLQLEHRLGPNQATGPSSLLPVCLVLFMQGWGGGGGGGMEPPAKSAADNLFL